MCGIIGYSGKQDIHTSELKALILMAQDRGSDSTGIATPSVTIKRADPAERFIGDHLPTDKTVIAHTRAKTTGIVSDRNSHPFEEEGFVGVHNGYISNFYNLRTSEQRMDMQVDSEIIWHMLSKYGLKEGIPQLRGGFALAWIDEDENLNLYRHTNPINIGFKDDALYFGSKREYLNVIGCEKVQSIDEHFQYVINNGDIVEEVDLTDYQPKRYNQYNRGKDTHGVRTSRNAVTYSPTVAPDDAEEIKIKDGPIIYFWFPDHTKTALCVEPCFAGIDYEWIENFDLTDPIDVATLEKNYKPVYNNKNVNDIIKQIG